MLEGGKLTRYFVFLDQRNRQGKDSLTREGNHRTRKAGEDRNIDHVHLLFVCVRGRESKRDQAIGKGKDKITITTNQRSIREQKEGKPNPNSL
jgi:hypothetical protein